MKIKNIFKKNSAKTEIQLVDKKQLEKLIGGTETDGTRPMFGGVISGATTSVAEQSNSGGEVWNQPLG